MRKAVKRKELKIIVNLYDKYVKEYKNIISNYNKLYDYLLKNRVNLIVKLKKIIEIFNLTQCDKFDDLNSILEGYTQFSYNNDVIKNKTEYKIEEDEQAHMAIVFNHFINTASKFYNNKHLSYRREKTFLGSINKLETEYASQYFKKRCKYLDSSLFTESNLNEKKDEILKNFAETFYGCALAEKRIGLLFYLYNYYNDTQLKTINTEPVKIAIQEEVNENKLFDLNIADLIDTDYEKKYIKELNTALCWLEKFNTDIDLNISCKKIFSVKSMKSIKSMQSIKSMKYMKSMKSRKSRKIKSA
jgi:hypothetical protein